MIEISYTYLIIGWIITALVFTFVGYNSGRIRK